LQIGPTIVVMLASSSGKLFCPDRHLLKDTHWVAAPDATCRVCHAAYTQTQQVAALNITSAHSAKRHTCTCWKHNCNKELYRNWRRLLLFSVVQSGEFSLSVCCPCRHWQYIPLPACTWHHPGHWMHLPALCCHRADWFASSIHWPAHKPCNTFVKQTNSTSSQNTSFTISGYEALLSINPVKILFLMRMIHSYCTS